MKDEFDGINKKLDIINDKLGEVNVTLAVNTASLIEHTRRTANLEDRVDPLEKGHAMFIGAMKLCGAIAAFATVVEVCLKLFGKH